MKLGPLPNVYTVERPLHDDWPWPLCYIPRRWTGLGLPMPPRQIAGNAPQRWIDDQAGGYPLAPCKKQLDNDCTLIAVWGPDPVPPIGCWTLQAVCLWGVWVPCFFAFSVKVFGRRLYFNGFLKPDVTLGDWYWWFEFSLTWTKIEEIA